MDGGLSVETCNHVVECASLFVSSDVRMLFTCFVESFTRSFPKRSVARLASCSPGCFGLLCLAGYFFAVSHVIHVFR